MGQFEYIKVIKSRQLVKLTRSYIKKIWDNSSLYLIVNIEETNVLFGFDIWARLYMKKSRKIHTTELFDICQIFKRLIYNLIIN